MQDPKTKRTIGDRDLEGLVTEVARGRISRRQFLTRAAAMGLSTAAIGSVLAACGSETTSGQSQSATVTDTTKPKQIYLYNWSDYMTDKCKKDFTKQTGIGVTETYFDDNEALLAKLKAGARGYDVIVPSDYMVHVLIKTGLLLPLDMSLIPNFEAQVDPKFKVPVYDNPEENGGKKFSVPYQWGTTGYAVRTDLLDANPTLWADLWNQSYSGHIQMLNDEREDLGAALQKNHFSLNTLDQTQLDKAKADLIAQKPLVRQYDSISPKRAMVQGNWLTHCWNGDVIVALWAGMTVKKLNYVMPQEGFPIYVDNLAMPVGSPSPYGAHLFMNYILDPATQGPLSSWIGYYSPTPAAKVDKVVLTWLPTAEDLKRGEVYNDLGQFSRNYTDAWAEVKSA